MIEIIDEAGNIFEKSPVKPKINVFFTEEEKEKNKI